MDDLILRTAIRQDKQAPGSLVCPTTHYARVSHDAFVACEGSYH